MQGSDEGFLMHKICPGEQQIHVYSKRTLPEVTVNCQNEIFS